MMRTTLLQRPLISVADFRPTATMSRRFAP